MRGFSSLLHEEVGNGLSAGCREYLRRIDSAAGRMDHLITDALSYSQAVRAKPMIARVDADELLHDMIESYPEFQSFQQNIHLKGKLPPVLANEAGLTQCFSNLLTNAIKFVRPGEAPNVTVRGERIDGVVRIWVEDRGIGIPPEMEPRMFGMFQRASKAYDGNGIGLALVRKVTERMGGRVGVEPAMEKGSRFWIELPAGNGS
jgi:signal transduction histidine kinase